MTELQNNRGLENVVLFLFMLKKKRAIPRWHGGSKLLGPMALSTLPSVVLNVQFSLHDIK